MVSWKWLQASIWLGHDVSNQPFQICQFNLNMYHFGLHGRFRTDCIFLAVVLLNLDVSAYAQVYIDKIVQHKIVNIFLPIIFNICFGCSKEPSS